jgi:hypothetical protein
MANGCAENDDIIRVDEFGDFEPLPPDGQMS